MLDKNKMIPGTFVEVKRNLDVTPAGATSSWDPVYKVSAGTQLKVIKKPRKLFGSINAAMVELPTGEQGNVHWMVLRNSCNHVE